MRRFRCYKCKALRSPKGAGIVLWGHKEQRRLCEYCLTRLCPLCMRGGRGSDQDVCGACENKLSIEASADNLQKVYVMRTANDGQVKIGRSRNPEARLRAINTSTPTRARLVLVTEPTFDAAEIEKRLHRVLYKDRANGEWFRCHMSKVLWAIEEIQTSERYGRLSFNYRLLEGPV